MCLSQDLTGMKKPINILCKIKSLGFPCHYESELSENAFKFDINGLKRSIELHSTKSFRVKALKTVGWVANAEAGKTLDLFTKKVKAIGCVMSDANKGSLEKHHALKSYNNIPNRSSEAILHQAVLSTTPGTTKLSN
ncbi:unnamed protein product [Lepeophtheirus salmonis]|uniref:(salmon louse) hypothetical protein n=1 Tax=Lepeophtheirus salmonis TaxID=72036 RepID=A0A7R8CYV7_LEPSM|nr:unnamed protein product [Lepeophtheirus salmonis]CAF2971883.1 unnamed protein product [Lepeophtheirus salmonis]